jgi:membrane protein YdbS with pleckstrin-like domain
MRNTLLRWRVAAQTALIVLGIIAAKLVIAAFSWEFIELSPLFTSVVAGGVFVLGLIVAGTLTDYKEAERVPSEMTAALTNIHDDCAAFKEAFPDLDMHRLEETEARIVEAFRHDLGDPDTVRALEAIDDLNATFLELDRIGVPATYTSRLRNEQGALRRSVLRVYHVQRTEFLPSAYLLIQSIVVIIITALAFTEIEPTYEAVIILAFISFFFVALLRLLRIMDRPFHVEEHTQDDVSLFLLRRFVERLDRSRA